MSVEFRQRTPGEYAQILWNSKWLILLPALAVSVAIAWVVYRLPNVYESTTLVVVKPPTISTNLVPSLSDADMTLRLNTISQIVMSRTTLQPIIERYDLFREERRRGDSMESLIDQVRRSVSVEVDRSRNEIANAFRITYRGRDPRSTQAVAAELASQYVNAQTKDVTQTSVQTKDFFQQQLVETKKQLDEIDQRRLQYMQQNLGTLPNEAGSLIGQLTGLREQQKTLITEIGRMRDQRTALSGQLSELEKRAQEDKQDIIETITDPKQTSAYAMLAQRKAQLEAEYQGMLTTLKPKNPDVVQKKAEIDSVQREMDAMVSEHKVKVEEKRKRLEGRPDPRLFTLKQNLQLIDNEIIRQQKILDQSDGQIAAIERRLNSVPGTEVGLEALNREYQTQKAMYDSLLEKEQRVSLAADVATNQKSEQIQVIDPANLPERPVAPKRAMLMGIGVGAGLGLGLLLAAIFQVPRILTVQSAQDAEHYTGLPVLAAVPQILTPREKTRLRFRSGVIALAGIVLTLLSIPALIFLLKVTRIFERLAG